METRGLVLPSRRFGFPVDDETGASFWPTYPGAIFINGSAAFRCEGVTMAPYAKAWNEFYINLIDSAGKIAKGYIDVADTTETLGSELITDGSFDTACGAGNWICDADWTITGGKASIDGNQSAKSQIAQSGIFDSEDVGKLYKVQITMSDYVAGKWQFLLSGDSQGLDHEDGANQTFTKYIVLGTYANNAIYVKGDTNLNCSIDDFSCKEVTHVGTDGALIMSTKGGTTQNWASIESGFDYNDSSGYTFDIYRAIS